MGLDEGARNLGREPVAGDQFKVRFHGVEYEHGNIEVVDSPTISIFIPLSYLIQNIISHAERVAHSPCLAQDAPDFEETPGTSYIGFRRQRDSKGDKLRSRALPTEVSACTSQR